MLRPLRWLLLFTGLAAGFRTRAQAQVAPVRPDSAHHYQHCCCCHHAVFLTELNNRIMLLLGMSVVLDRSGKAYFGIVDNEAGRAITPRLTLGGRILVTNSRSSASNYDYAATAPAINLLVLAGTAHYQLLNTRRWRLEAVAGLGAGGVQLYDDDHQIASAGKNGRTTYPATVFFSVHPLLEGGAGLTYKLSDGCWLSSRLSYRYLPGTGALGTPGEFSGPLATVALALPWGWHPARAAALGSHGQ